MVLRPCLYTTAMMLVVLQTWLNCQEDNTSVHVTRSLSDGNLAALLKKCQQPRSCKVESTSGSVLRRNQPDIRETAEKHVFLSTDDYRQRNFHATAADDDEHAQSSSSPIPTTVETPTRSLTAEPEEPPVTPAVAEAVQILCWFAYSQRIGEPTELE